MTSLYIILNPRAHGFQAGEQLHARSVHSIFPRHQQTCKMRPFTTTENKKRDKLGDKLGNKGDKALGRRTHHPTKENKKEDKLGGSGETRWKTNWRQGRQGLRKADTPSNKGKQEGRGGRQAEREAERQAG